MDEYLGDGAYVKFDYSSQELIVYTSDGISITNQVVLGPSETVALLEFLKRLASNKWLS